ncbi:receptor-type tyrosine-protein phosphatase eta isoform X2 [Chanos chanos]|uniref:protein-tyrosine-phosphatase n=1 Tax=Chanos chanos TaxID=29144 RepID=A0A6J2WMT0_CHACN|nr:receptor-type tyrosine-protein phosphatase eta-like isoform X2 [Chanos chanos]
MILQTVQSLGVVVILCLSLEILQAQADNPETTQPSVYNQGTNNSIYINWTAPSGNVEKYIVLLNSSDGETSNQTLNSAFNGTNIFTVTFNDLSAGTLYTVIVSSVSGPFDQRSEPVSIATYPNPPGEIVIVNKTTHSITIEWGAAPLMAEGSHSYNVTYSNSSHSDSVMTLNTENTSVVLSDLLSGTPYNISVVTVGPQDLRSEAVQSIQITTRPYPATDLNATALSTSAVSLKWTQPREHQTSYTYHVHTSDCISPSSNQTVNITEADITNLTPGTNCLFSVYVQARDGTEGESVSEHQYTHPETTQPSVYNKGTNNSIYINWTAPSGYVEKYIVLLNSSDGETSNQTLNSPFNGTNIFTVTFNDLSAGTLYTVIVSSVSGPFDQRSEPVSIATYPNPPGEIVIVNKTTHSITIEWGAAPLMAEGSHSYNVTYSNSSHSDSVMTLNTENTSVVLSDLLSGTPYNISVVTVGPQDLRSEAVQSIQITTRPYPVTGLSATAPSTSAVLLKWTEPQEHQTSYTYRVHTSNCISTSSNQTVNITEADITNLTPGTKCLFSVYVRARDGTEGESVSEHQYTRPETTQPSVYNQGTNNSIYINWTAPSGNVEKYIVLLNSSDGETFNQTLSSPFNGTNIFTVTFNDLSAGTLYTVIVSFISGPFDQRSEPVSIATYPNPPGEIVIMNKTTHSITIEWGAAPLMAEGSHSYTVKYSNSSHSDSIQTLHTSVVLPNLLSGTPYDISVVTVGPQDLRREAVQSNQITTRPYPVTGLSATAPSTSAVLLKWTEPQEHQTSYTYRVHTSNCISTSSNQTVNITEADITNLTPGTKCLFSVYVRARDGTEGETVSVHQYTRPETTQPSVYNQGTNNSIYINWTAPSGNVEKYIVLLNSSDGETFNQTLSSPFNGTNIFTVTFNDLSAGTLYTVIVSFISGPFDQRSEPVSIATYPNPPGEIVIMNKTTHSVTIEWGAAPLMAEGSHSYTVKYSNSSHSDSIQTLNTSVVLPNLLSGTPYDISVVTVGPQDLRSEAVQSNQITTRPYPVTGLSATAPSTSAVLLKWTEPQEHQTSYTYRVHTSNCISTSSNQTVNITEADITNLTPGTKCSFSVYVRARDGTEGESVSEHQYTRPETTQPSVYNQGTNNSIYINWTAPSGNVEKYIVLLNSSDGETFNQTLSSPFNGTNIFTVTFNDLSAGTLYTVIVSFISGPFDQRSEPVSIATYPNPPGEIVIMNKTTHSITIEWGAAPLMAEGSHSYTVKYSNSSHSDSIQTLNTSVVLPNLLSGTPYYISVVTVGPQDLRSEAVQSNQITTRPYPVTGLSATAPSTSAVLLKWTEPQEHQTSYTYRVHTSNCISTSSNQTVNITEADITNLTPGTKCLFSVYVRARDGTEGESVSEHQYTRPETTQPSVYNQGTNNSIYINWTAPSGNVEKYIVLLNSSDGETFNQTLSSPFNGKNIFTVTFNDLSAGTLYTVIVSFISGPFDQRSEPVSIATYPNPPGEIVIMNKTTHSITIEWGAAPLMAEGSHSYTVKYSNSSHSDSIQTLHTSVVLPNLLSGTPYYISVVTVGPQDLRSEAVQSNQITTRPYPVTGLSATALSTSAVSLKWTQPREHQASYTYRVHTSNCISPSSNQTVHITEADITNLTPGTKCLFSVYVRARDGTEGESVSEHQYTRPQSVTLLKPQISQTSIKIHWEAPADFGETYQFRVLMRNLTSIITNISTASVSHFEGNLEPGCEYDFNVTTLTSDQTEGKPVGQRFCTDTRPVSASFTCEGPNQTAAMLRLNWAKPDGCYSAFQIEANKKTQNFSKETCGTVCQYNVTELSYFEDYEVSISTLGCGKNSVHKVTCKTGITAPPLLLNPGQYVEKNETHYKSFSLFFHTSLLNSSHGPVTHYGLLLTTNPNKNNTVKDDMNNTYDDWKTDKTKSYLTVLKKKEHKYWGIEDPIYVFVGDDDTQNLSKTTSYKNGQLTFNQPYRYAVVVFTQLSMSSDGRVNVSKSIFSMTSFSMEAITLLKEPVNIGTPVAAALGVLVCLLSVCIILFIYWRRQTKKLSSSIAINTLRSKVSLPVKIEEYEAYYKQQRANSDRGFAEEFEELKSVGVAQANTSALAVENKGKNRYINVLPYEISRVKLSILGSPYDDYINANYIPGHNSRKEFIAAQGPLPNTVDDFWRMIWEQNVHTMVMLTKCNEQGRVKCEEYWPSESKHYNNITVTTTSEISVDEWTIRDFDVKNVKTAETRSVRHFHFTAWPDHGVPETPELLIDFRFLVREHMDQYSRHSPTVVHCSAGVGRTGTFVALDRLIFQIERESVADVYGVVHDMRMQRPLMVQTEDQYVFIHQCVMDIIKSRTGTNVDLIYQNSAAL